MTLPGLLVLGAPKCGTSTLAAWWDAHPQGYTAPGKEVGFFTPYWSRGLDWYRDQFAGAAPGQVTCDASPGYLYSPEALDRIAQVLPDARLAVVLREPVSRVWSHWCYMVALGLEPRAFATVLDQEEQDEGVTPPDFPVGYVRASRYPAALQEVLQRFPRE
ncbi:MAG: sulfotransferase, partial [Actinomycetota bacterium]|nr:sulfotransferase [Actinomycetota bacterium]